MKRPARGQTPHAPHPLQLGPHPPSGPVQGLTAGVGKPQLSPGPAGEKALPAWDPLLWKPNPPSFSFPLGRTLWPSVACDARPRAPLPSSSPSPQPNQWCQAACHLGGQEPGIPHPCVRPGARPLPPSPSRQHWLPDTLFTCVCVVERTRRCSRPQTPSRECGQSACCCAVAPEPPHSWFCLGFVILFF